MTEVIGEVQPFYVGDIVKPFVEAEPLHFFEAKMNVQATSQVDGTRFDVSFDHPPLDAVGLLALLNQIAPGGKVDNAGGIIDDWEIVDNLTGKSNKGNRDLVKLHRKLGGAWKDFMGSRAAFLDVMSDGYKDFSEFKVLVKEESLRTSDMLYRLARRPDLGKEILAQAFKIGDFQNPEALALAAIHAQVNKTRSPGRQITNPRMMQHTLNQKSESARAQMIRSIVHDLPPEVKSVFTLLARDTYYDFVVLENGERFSVPKNSVRGDLSEQLGTTDTVRRGKYAMQIANVAMRSSLSGNRYVNRRVAIPGTEVKLEETSTITPKLSWFTPHDGQREFIIERQAETGEHMHYVDGVAGVLLAAYLSPGVCSKWQAGISIKGSKRKEPQTMGPAQVPVLALFPGSKKQLADSLFVHAAEAKAV
jgi:hypothetical protein